MTALGLVLGSPSAETEPRDESRARVGTTIVVQVNSNRGPASTSLLGVNHHFDANGRHLWDSTRDAPVPAVVNGAVKAGLQSMRFPGGTVANLYDWKRAIGSEHGCQVVGPHGPDKAVALTRGLAFGPDEYMRFLDRVGARPLIMVPFVTETPADAADWVEYMNGRAGTRANPHGGVDWADVRAANGHRAPYAVRWWEIGNEQHHEHSRYWMSPDNGLALRQYAFGGSRVVSRENLGKDCDHRTAGIRSDGAAQQTFEALYPPVAPGSFRVVIGGRAWTRVASLATAGPRARVFKLDAARGRVRFGDGQHGAIPPRGSKVQASYRSVHEGYFAFAREMKEADPSIKVCSSWGDPTFNRVVGHRRYDCLAAHAITQFSKSGGGRARWSGPLEGHDQFMLKSESVRTRIHGLRGTMPRSTPLLLTEFVAMHGDARAYPAWATSVSHAVYMSSLWANWLNLRIRWGNGDDFLWSNDRAMLGPAPHYTFTADAVTRRALAPMFSEGGALLATRVAGNPVRPAHQAPGSYPGLTVAATRLHGAVRLLVVNRLPGKSVTTRIQLAGGRARGTAGIRSVTGRSFTDWNRPSSRPRVTLKTRSRPVGPTGFSYVFPPASTTVIRIPLR